LTRAGLANFGDNGTDSSEWKFSFPIPRKESCDVSQQPLSCAIFQVQTFSEITQIFQRSKGKLLATIMQLSGRPKTQEQDLPSRGTLFPKSTLEHLISIAKATRYRSF
jgi:hypothetical protein